MKKDTSKKIEIIGVSSHWGSPYRGVAHAAEKLRELGLVQLLRQGDFVVKDSDDLHGSEIDIESLQQNPHSKFADQVYEVCDRLQKKVLCSYENGFFPLVIGGDHSISMGSVSASARFHQKIGVIWFDAHGDINTPETSPTGHLHGMPVAHLVGLGLEKLNQLAGFSPAVQPENFVLIGTRDLDPGEHSNIKDTGVHLFTAEDIKSFGLSTVIQKAVDLATKNTAGIHVSFDLDVLDPRDAPGVSLQVQNGLSLEDACLALQQIKASEKMIAFEIAEMNCEFDQNSKTLYSALDLVRAAFSS